MDHPKITGPQDYQRFFYMSLEGLVWLDKKGNPIPLLQLLDMHIDTIDPSELWNAIETRIKVCRQNFTTPGSGPTNSTTIDAKVPILMTLTSPIMEHHVEARNLENSSIVTIKELLADPKIQPGMMQSVLSVVTSLFTPSKVTSTGDNNLAVTNEAPIGSTPSVETRDVNTELNDYKDRMALELSNFKRHLETQSHIKVECAKQNLKSEFNNQLQHQTLMQTETINMM